MAFWTDIGDKKRYVAEPLRQFRWYITFGDPNGYSKTNKEDIIPLDNYTFALKDCIKPSFKIDTSQHVLLNHTFNYPKNLVWNPIAITFASAFDSKNISLTQALQRIIMASGYSTPKFSVENQNQISKKYASFPRIELKQIDEEGTVVEIWILQNCFINDVNYGNLNYNSEDIVEIKISMVYDYAYLATAEKTLEELKAFNESRAADRAEQTPRPIALGGEVNGNNIRSEGLLLRTPNNLEEE